MKLKVTEQFGNSTKNFGAGDYYVLFLCFKKIF